MKLNITPIIDGYDMFSICCAQHHNIIYENVIRPL